MKSKKEKWITSTQAADILSERSRHLVSTDYVRRLANTGKITTKALDSRTKLFLRADVEEYVVKPRGTGEVRRAVRGKKAEAAPVKEQEVEPDWWKPEGQDKPS